MTNGVKNDDPAALLDRVRAGDEAAFRALYNDVAPVALRVAGRIVRDASAAEDVVHDALYGMLLALRSGRGPSGTYLGYIVASVRRLAFQHVRARGQAVCVGDATEVETELTPAPLPISREADIAAAAMASLPAHWQRILWLIEVDRYTPAELARGMSLSANAVSSLATRARRGLRSSFVAQQQAT